MKSVLRLIRQAFHNAFLYKKRFNLTLVGIILSSVVINVGIIFSNINLSSARVDTIEFPPNTGIFSYDPSSFKLDYLQHEIVEKETVSVSNAEYHFSEISVNLFGVKNNFLDFPIENSNYLSSLIETKLIYGEPLSDVDQLKGNNYILLQAAYADLLFPKLNPLNQIIEIAGKPYIVKGILATTSDVKRKLAHNSGDELMFEAYIPQSNFDVNFKSTKTRTSIIFRYDNIAQISNDIEANTYVTYDDVFQSFQQTQTEYISRMFVFFAVMVLASAILELLVMTFNFKERLYEIGIKRAVGATKDDICFELLFESFCLGIIGILFGIFFSYLIAFVSSVNFFKQAYIFVNVLSVNNVLIVSAFVFFVLAIASIIPAISAANTNIVDVIKGE